MSEICKNQPFFEMKNYVENGAFQITCHPREGGDPSVV
jgi:hypothetical protein